MKCSVDGCEREADFKVINYDVYVHFHSTAEVFFEQDFTCPFLCSLHVSENEFRAEGIRQPRGFVKYPHSNKNGAQGFTVYLPLEKEKQESLLRLLQSHIDSPAAQN